MPMMVSNVKNLTITIDAKMYMSEDNINWPSEEKGSNGAHSLFHIIDSEYIHIRGDGHIEGQGYWWWMREYIVANKHGRPHMLQMERVRHCIIEKVSFYNSPRYHMALNDIDDFLI